MPPLPRRTRPRRMKAAVGGIAASRDAPRTEAGAEARRTRRKIPKVASARRFERPSARTAAGRTETNAGPSATATSAADLTAIGATEIVTTGRPARMVVGHGPPQRARSEFAVCEARGAQGAARVRRQRTASCCIGSADARNLRHGFPRTTGPAWQKRALVSQCALGFPP